MKKVAPLLFIFLITTFLFSQTKQSPLHQKKFISTIGINPLPLIQGIGNLEYSLTYNTKHLFGLNYGRSFLKDQIGHGGMFYYGYFYKSEDITRRKTNKLIGFGQKGFGIFLRGADGRGEVKLDNDPNTYLLKSTLFTPGAFYTKRYIFNKGFFIASRIGIGVPIEVGKGIRWHYDQKPASEEANTAKTVTKIMGAMELGVQAGFSF